MSHVTLLQKIYTAVVTPVLWILFGAALIALMWGIAVCIRDSGSDTGRETCKRHLIWAMIGLLIMFSVFGITSIVADTLGVDSPQEQLIP